MDTQTHEGTHGWTDRLIPVCPKKHLSCRSINTVDKEKMLMTSIFSFFKIVFESLLFQSQTKFGLFDKGLIKDNSLTKQEDHNGPILLT